MCRYIKTRLYFSARLWNSVGRQKKKLLCSFIPGLVVNFLVLTMLLTNSSHQYSNPELFATVGSTFCTKNSRTRLLLVLHMHNVALCAHLKRHRLRSRSGDPTRFCWIFIMYRREPYVSQQKLPNLSNEWILSLNCVNWVHLFLEQTPKDAPILVQNHPKSIQFLV